MESKRLGSDALHEEHIYDILPQLSFVLYHCRQWLENAGGICLHIVLSHSLTPVQMVWSSKVVEFAEMIEKIKHDYEFQENTHHKDMLSSNFETNNINRQIKTTHPG